MNELLHQRIEEIKEESQAVQFAYDGCHKIYLIADGDDLDEAKLYEYDIYPIERLESVFVGSCPFRFISSWKTKENYIEQCEFEFEDQEEN
jgi:hypothetical protein